MKQNKTTASNASVTEFVSSLLDVQQLEETRTLISLFEKATKQKPVMWGPAIIGFGSTHLKYASGRELDFLKVGFSPRKGKFSLYLTFDAAELTSKFPKLGTYKIGKGCIYITRLSDIDSQELTKVIAEAYRAT